MKFWLGHTIYLIVLSALAVAVPSNLWDPEAANFIFLLGFIAIWRYSWWGINLTRFLIYKHLVFPKWRKQANDLGADGLPSHVYLLVTSFRIGTETTRRVYDSIMAEAIRYNNKFDLPITIVVSIVEKADEILIKQLFNHYNPPDAIKLVSVRINGTGKRDALAYGFRAISKSRPPIGSVTAVIDGDSLLEDGLIEKCSSMFVIHPKLGALTTDETCEVDGSDIFKNWYDMRFAQRNIYMCSVSLSKRVLTLTGRMSMFRTDIITDPEFIERVELDWLDHPRLGRFKFLTGDDKSSWHHILSKGYEMLYVPDVNVLTIETPPYTSFVRSSLTLMQRWFGNMLRTNGRAIKLGIKPMGFFPWISIVDQRISMWTSLTGFTVSLLATFSITPFAFIYYILWMAITRYILCLTFLFSRPRISAIYPFLLYYNQIVGALVKTYILFRLDKQKWTRQGTVLKTNRSLFAQKLTNAGSFYMHGFSFCLFTVALGTISGIMQIPDFKFWLQLVNG